MSSQYADLFLEALQQSEGQLSLMGFERHSVREIGLCIVEYRSSDCVVNLFYGPPEFHIELTVSVNRVKFELKDLYRLPGVMQWAQEWADAHKGQAACGAQLHMEVKWAIGLLEFVLPILKGRGHFSLFLRKFLGR